MVLCRLFLGAIFVYASYDKILHPVPFAEIVYNYQILPDILVNLAALFLPWIELLVGLSLILGVGLPGAVLTSNGLLLLFFSTLVFNMARGLDIDCGCFTTAVGPSSGGHMLWYLFRDGFFLLTAAFLLVSSFLLKPRQVSQFDRPWKTPFGQTLALVLSGALLGFLANQVRSDSIPLPGDWSPEARIALKFGKNILIPLDEAKDRFFTGSAVFVDARPRELFEAGHIQGARNLPIAQFDQLAEEVFTEFQEDTLFITYCDGEDCDLSGHLALKLKQIGYENVRVLHNGWSAWKSHHLPVVGVKEHEG
jgi:rhodanese-related sulfurtransferase